MDYQRVREGEINFVHREQMHEPALGQLRLLRQIGRTKALRLFYSGACERNSAKGHKGALSDLDVHCPIA